MTVLLAFCACMGALIYVEITDGWYIQRLETFVATIVFVLWSLGNIVLGFLFAVRQAGFSSLYTLGRQAKIDLYEREGDSKNLFLVIH